MGIDKTKRQRKQATRAMVARLLTSATLATMIVVCIYTFNFLTTTEKLAITNVDFDGLSRMGSEEIEAIVADIRGQNILLVPLGNYAARFDDHPRIRSAGFRRVLPDKVVCTVVEREPVALVYSNKFLEVDDQGMIMNSDDLTDLLDLPIITGLDSEVVQEGRPCEDAQLAGALKTLMLCKKYGGSFADDISELRVGDHGLSIVSLREGVVILLGKSEFESRLAKFFDLKETIAQRGDSARLFDLRFDDQIVLRSGI